jgi:hypothetical protein
MDFILADVSNIIHSYLSHQIEKSDVSSPPGPVVESDSDASNELVASENPPGVFSSLGDLNEKLNEIKAQIE